MSAVYILISYVDKLMIDCSRSFVPGFLIIFSLCVMPSGQVQALIFSRYTALLSEVSDTSTADSGPHIKASEPFLASSSVFTFIYYVHNVKKLLLF